VCKIGLKRNLRRFYVEMLSEIIINKTVKSRMISEGPCFKTISLSLLDSGMIKGLSLDKSVDLSLMV